MERAPDLRPEHGSPADAGPRTKRQPLARLGQRNDGSRSAQPYIPISLPSARAGRGGWWKWLAALLLAAGLSSGAYYIRGGLAGAKSAASAPSSERRLGVTQADIDLEATALARQMLSVEGLDDTADVMERAPAAQFTNPPQSGSSSAAAPETAPPAASAGPRLGVSGLPVVERRRLVRAALSHATPAVRKEIADGRQAIYALHLLDNMVEDGDAVILYVNGNSQGRILLTNRGQTVLVALPTGALSQIRVLAVEDGGGGVTFGASSSLGEIRSKVMAVGDSDNWTVVPQ